MTEPARTLTDAELDDLAERLAKRLEGRLADLAKARPANAPTKPLTISPTTQAAARAELERRGLRTRKTHRAR